jgi:hypothetical protein
MPPVETFLFNYCEWKNLLNKRLPAGSVPVPETVTTNPSAGGRSGLVLAAPVLAEGAPGPPAVRQPAESQSLDEWLVSIELGGYTTAIKEMGYVSLTFLLEAEPGDIEEIARETQEAIC